MNNLSKEIVKLLVRKRGAKLSLREIADRLGVECGDTGEPWQNVCRLAHALAKLEDAHRIESAPPKAGREAVYWIDPPKDAAP